MGNITVRVRLAKHVVAKIAVRFFPFFPFFPWTYIKIQCSKL